MTSSTRSGCRSSAIRASRRPGADREGGIPIETTRGVNENGAPGKTFIFRAKIPLRTAFHWVLSFRYVPRTLRANSRVVSAGALAYTDVTMFRDLPIRARELKATPAVLERIYEGARLGLKGESLALAAGLLPEEFARLKLMDRTAEIAEMKGRPDSELSMSRVVFEAAENGDAKAALEFLRHKCDWTAAQRIQVDVSQQISITAALEQAQRRVQAIEDAVIVEPQSLARPIPLARETLGAEV